MSHVSTRIGGLPGASALHVISLNFDRPSLVPDLCVDPFTLDRVMSDVYLDSRERGQLLSSQRSPLTTSIYTTDSTVDSQQT